MAPRPDVSEERRNQILEAAATVFAQLGFHKARMDDIVKATGLSKGTLYWYFKSKDDIVMALMERFFDLELADVQAVVASGGSALQRLAQVTRQIADELEQLAELLPVGYEFYAVAARDEPVRDYFRTYFRTFRGALATLIRQGIERGEFRTVDVEETAIIITAIYEGVSLLSVIDPQAVKFDALGEAAIRLLLDGLRAEEGQ